MDEEWLNHAPVADRPGVAPDDARNQDYKQS